MNNIEKITKELSDYIDRKFKIEEMILEAQELDIECSMLKAQQYQESVQTTRECPNNDVILHRKEELEQRIKMYKLRNQRIETKINRIRKDYPRQAIYKYYIEGKDKRRVSRELDRSLCQIGNLLRQGIETLSVL